MNQAKQAVNPYLPSYEYVPDGEPHVFNGRVYVYGSHDRFGGNDFCLNDYVCWSARADDLANWRYEGTSYRSVQDPCVLKAVPPCACLPPMCSAAEMAAIICSMHWNSAGASRWRCRNPRWGHSNFMTMCITRMEPCWARKKDASA